MSTTGRTQDEMNLNAADRPSAAKQDYMLFSVREKLARRLAEKKLSTPEIAAIQRQLEEEALNEWREKFAEIKNRMSS